MSYVIEIKNIIIECDIGCYDAEKAGKQAVEVTLLLEIMAEKVDKTWLLSDTVDYDWAVGLARNVFEMRHYDLVEHAIFDIGAAIMANTLVVTCSVELSKLAVNSKHGARISVTRVFDREDCPLQV